MYEAKREQTAWKLSTRSVPEEKRNAAWSEAMRRLKLPFVTNPDVAPVNGRMTVLTSPMGVQFARILANTQTIAGREANQEAGLWLMCLIRGNGVFISDGEKIDVKSGSILFGATRHDSRLDLSDHCELLFARIPTIVMGPRMLAPLTRKTGLLSQGTAVESILSQFLVSTAKNMDTITREELLPIEISLIEMLTFALTSLGGQRAKGGATGARAAHLQRIQQRLETMLDDPELTLIKVANRMGVSPRYLQRLFAAEKLNFSTYLKERRLERCYTDLVSPVCAQLSISEIAFRWGFNGSAHFSRSFRARYNMSPREHRNRHASENSSLINS